MTYVLYDGSFLGILSAIYDIYDLKIKTSRLCKKHEYHQGLFDMQIEVATDISKSNRVKAKLIKLLNKNGFNDLYRAHLHESQEADDTILHIIKLSINTGKNILSNYNIDAVLNLQKILKKISRERHRMTAFVRFKQGVDGIYTATIEPDFNVLPLIMVHFKKRYADQEWIIYDTARHYGIYYDLNRVIEVELVRKDTELPQSSISLTEDEEKFQQLWKDYFHATNIKSRKNTKLHLQHVPKRYWKYLIEKQ